MKNVWSDLDANAAIRLYRAQGYNEDIALRTYTTRLLGGEPKLVQHGGGNTSVKTTVRDAAGETVDVLCVKGSGWDMAVIEPPGLPAVRLKPLLKLANLKSLSDEDMVAFQRGNLIDSKSPTPSVETLLHAFIPHKFIDHTHANAVLALVDREDGIDVARKVYGKRVAIVPYVMPGFDLSIKAKKIFEENPDVEGLVLHKHGIFSFGATAREAYDRMIDLVSRAERFVELEKGEARKPKALKAIANVTEILPVIRGAVSIPLDRNDGRWTRFVLEYRVDSRILSYVNGGDLARYSQRGPATPDHVIRTKPRPLVLPMPEVGKLKEFAAATRKAVETYQRDYRRYFERHNARAEPKKVMLDPIPRVVLVPGVGLFGLGETARDARIAADIAETSLSVVLDAEKGGGFESISERDQFDMEYWSLEQAKLAGRTIRPMQGQIAVVTGAAGTIGMAVAAALRAQGAEVALLDMDVGRAAAAAKQLGGIAVSCDVTDPASVNAAIDSVVSTYGGIDIVVSNAGAAWQGKIGEVDDALLRKSFELNFFGHQYIAQAAVRVIKAQNTGGALLFNVSKQAVNPGPNFGPYGLPKAALLALMRQYAIDYGDIGITSNGVNADRIRSGLLTSDMVAKRSKARGLSERDYMAGNLLGREVRANDVAEAFVSLALSRKTTGALLTVDGGNIAAALR